MDEKRLPLTEHLTELRSRLVKCFIAVGIGFLISYQFSERIFGYLMIPLVKSLPEGSTMVFTGLPEAFFTYLKTAFISGTFLAVPFILYQMWMFVAPGLYPKERRPVLPFVLFSSLFFIGGALFGYFIVFPIGFKFFLSYASDIIKPLPSVKEYLSLSAKLLLAFGLIFELPILTLFLAKMGLITHKFMTRNRRYAILLIFVVGAILTPPDVITQLMMAGPLLILYELSILVAWTFEPKPLGGKEKKERPHTAERKEKQEEPAG